MAIRRGAQGYMNTGRKVAALGSGSCQGDNCGGGRSSSSADRNQDVILRNARELPSQEHNQPIRHFTVQRVIE